MESKRSKKNEKIEPSESDLERFLREDEARTPEERRAHLISEILKPINSV